VGADREIFRRDGGMSMGALSGIRVLDLTRVLAGPMATQTLADLGAEVIKIERPGSGDDTRAWGPPYVKDDAGRDTSESTYFACANRGKKSLAIDLSKAAGQELVRELAQRSDVMLENFKTGDLQRYALDYAALAPSCPRLVYASITGYGQNGPYAARAGYDPIAQALCGLMSVTGEEASMTGSSPQRAGVAVVDLLTAQYAVVGILAALLHRQHSGRGQYLDMALLNVGVASMANVSAAYLGAGVVGTRNGGVHPSVVPSQVFRCRDGFVSVAAGNDGQFAKLCEVCGEPQWSTDPRFLSNTMRVQHKDEIVALLAVKFSVREVRWWNDALARAGVPCAPVLDIAQVFDDPQVKHRQMKVHIQHPLAGSMAMIANPIQLSDTPPRYELPPPLLGQHSGEVLRDVLGLDEAQVGKLIADGVVASR
jgi:formyl-CoA transferase